MKELLYSVNSGLVAGALLISMVIAIEAGFRIGLRGHGSTNEASRSHVNAIQASILGILALLLGFTFSLSLQRFDARSAAVVHEANAIGTAYLRAQLLPVALRGDVQALLREYVDTRVAASATTLVDVAERSELLAQAARVQAALWASALQAAEMEPNPVTTGLFIQSLNDLIDSYGHRNAALELHVPEVVLFLLFVTFLMAGGTVGYSTGLTAVRQSFATYVMVALMVVLVFLVLDLDRPRRGFIPVSQQSLLDLQASISAETGEAIPEDRR